MIGKFHLAMVEPVAWEQELDRLISSLGWGKGLPVAEINLDRQKVKEHILIALEKLDDDGDPNQVKSIEDKILKRREHFLVKLPVSSWDVHDYSYNFRTSEESDILVCSNSSKTSSPSELKAKDTLTHPLLLGKSRGRIKKTKEEIINLLDPIIKTGSQFMIVDYIFGREIKPEQNSWGRWQSIIDLIKKIWNEKKTSCHEPHLDASIELHTCVDPHQDREKIVNKIENAIPVGCEIKLFSWKCEYYKNSYNPRFSGIDPHERMFLTESIGINIEKGYGTGGYSQWSLYDLSKIDEERVNYTPSEHNGYDLHWSEEITRKRFTLI